MPCDDYQLMSSTTSALQPHSLNTAYLYKCRIKKYYLDKCCEHKVSLLIRIAVSMTFYEAIFNMFTVRTITPARGQNTPAPEARDIGLGHSSTEVGRVKIP